MNLNNFNFKGKCQEPFKYRPHRERDLIFTAARYNTKGWQWSSHRRDIKQAAKIMAYTMPKVKKVCVVYMDSPRIISYLKECGFEIIQAKQHNRHKRTTNAAIDRFNQLKMYLDEHQGEFDRVALIDIRDIFFFADGFQTISDDEVVFSEECDKYSETEMYCIDYSQNNVNYDWLKRSYGNEIAEKYRKESKRVNNVGIIIGGIKPFTQLLDVFLEEIPKRENVLDYWGIDNAILNYLRYSGKFDGINLTINTYSQRIAFAWKGGYDYDIDKKIVTNKDDGCSPIIRHKLARNPIFEMGK